ncbi:MAG TPA: protein-disulfide reductase DsbD domain-containing protein [Pyrinomonadaceae bacterium]|nr:protein-disulfide reductase DsbD domain-containing protein [Pyrinomonadaceae bacterium]
MNKNSLFFFFIGMLVFGMFAASAAAQTITGSVTGGSVTRGSKARGVITMSIPSGLHVNSNRPSSQYAIATTVRISGTGMRSASVSYPRGRDRKFEFSETPINVYQGTVRFPFSIGVPANFSGRNLKLRAVVHYQACTNEVCYPPKDKEITFTAAVR